MSGFDVIVIGGGHAGAEAAHAAARLGARTALITMASASIGRMSCNPAIGGLGKGHMVREIDALGGLMARAIDATGIQFRMLNKSKGPAVWAPRAQADRNAYAAEVQRILSVTPHLEIIEGVVEDIVTASPGENSDAVFRVTGVVLDGGRRLEAERVVITTGTFMRALMHCGTRQTHGGRIGERASSGLSPRLESLGFEIARLKTGTPPRVARDSIHYDALDPQPGDATPEPFSFMTASVSQPQINCWITYTNERTHDIIRDHLHEAPMFTGQIRATGPRYCPSIEDKVVRFAEKPRHQVFLEPEGYDDERVYCNGISTSLPAAVQTRMVRSITGLERARIIQSGYAVEYDWLPTHQIKSSLETKRGRGLYLAGQINGTSGYEEAAAQGLLAGINAARAVGGQSPLILGRDQAYIGVLIDDLVTRPPDEPYRMFTSRAEYRLLLRSDNADQRLTPIGRRVRMVDDIRWNTFQEKMDRIQGIKDRLRDRTKDGKPLAEWAKRTDVAVDEVIRWLGRDEDASTDSQAVRQAVVDARYSGYIARQQRQIERFQKLEAVTIPGCTDYASLRELRHEAREKLLRLRPATLGQASRISGINPADITVLWVFLRKARGRR